MKKIGIFVGFFILVVYLIACTSMGSNPSGDRLIKITKSAQYNIGHLRKYEKNTPSLLAALN